MGKHQTKICNVCFKTMRGDYLERHMMRMDHLMCNNEGTARKVVNEDNIVNKGLNDVGTDHNISNMGLDDRKTENNVENNEELEKKVSAQMEEFNRKIEIGRKVKFILDKHGLKKVGLSHELKDALKTYGLHGETKDDMYTCTYCENVKTYRLHDNEDKYKCTFCGNLSFVKTDEQWEIMLNNKELYDEELEKRVSSEMEEFNRKIELGRKVKFILDKNGYNTNGLENELKEALKTFELNSELIEKDMRQIS